MIISSRVSHQCIDGEVVVIDLQSGTYYSLIDTAVPIWNLLAAGASRREIVNAATGAWPEASVKDDVDEFLDGLLADGVVREDGPSAPSSTSGIEFPSNYVPPRAEKFTDMQELLMLDPIHEVDSAGWPHKTA